MTEELPLDPPRRALSPIEAEMRLETLREVLRGARAIDPASSIVVYLSKLLTLEERLSHSVTVGAAK